MSVLVNVRVSESERAAWKAAASEVNLTLTDFVKAAVAARLGGSSVSAPAYVSPLRARGFRPDFKGGGS